MEALQVKIMKREHEMGVMTLNFRLYWQRRNWDSAPKCHYGTLRDTIMSLSPSPQGLRLAGTSTKP